MIRPLPVTQLPKAALAEGLIAPAAKIWVWQIELAQFAVRQNGVVKISHFQEVGSLELGPV